MISPETDFMDLFRGIVFNAIGLKKATNILVASKTGKNSDKAGKKARYIYANRIKA